MARKKKTQTEKKDKVTLSGHFKLVNGQQIEMTVEELEEFENMRKGINEISNSRKESEMLDRSKITDDMKKELKKSLKKNSALEPIIKILLGSKETEALLKE